MNAACFFLIFRTEIIVLSEIYLLKGKNDGILEVFGNLIKGGVSNMPTHEFPSHFACY